MKKKVKTKMLTLSKKIGSVLIAVSMITGACAPAVTSFTQAQPVAKKKAKIKKKKKAKRRVKKRVKRKTLKTVNLTKGKSKTISVRSKSKVTWKTSNKSVVSVKSISKSKVKITAKKAGSANVTGKAKSAKWNVKVKVKGNKKPTPKPSRTSSKKSKKSKSKFDIIFSGRYYGALDANDTIEYNGTNRTSTISAYSKQYKKIKYSNLSPDIIKINFIHYIPISPSSDIPGKGEAACNVIPLKAGKAAVKVSYPGGEKIYNITVKETNYYKVAKNVITKVKASGLDDAHKAFVLAKWIEARATYDNNVEWGGISKLIIEGKGVCQGYTDTLSWLLDTVGITNRRVATWEHTWNQIKINGKWYNIDVTLDDSSNEDSEDFSSRFFMKSDGYTEAPDPANPQIGPYQPFNETGHEINKREGYKKGKDYELANGTDYDSYDWLSFYQSSQFKELVND